MLVTRLRDGTEVKLAEHRIHERMKDAIRALEAEGVEFVVLFCTGEFHGMESKGILLRPDALLYGAVKELIGNGRLGACVPSAKQIPAMAKKWAGVGRDCVCVGVSPYTGTDEDFIAAARQLAESKPDLVIMDCIGYSSRMRETVPPHRRRARHPAPDLPRTPGGRTFWRRKMTDLSSGAKVVLSDCLGASAGETLLVVTDTEKREIGEALFAEGLKLGLKANLLVMQPTGTSGAGAAYPRRRSDEEGRHRPVPHQVFP